MRFVVDESCDAAVLRALRGAGWDVVAISERIPGATDLEVIAIALSEGRVLVTEDKDFGQLVYAAGREHAGVILLRYSFPLASSMATSLVHLVHEHDQSLSGAFVVLRPGSARIVTSPGGG